MLNKQGGLRMVSTIGMTWLLIVVVSLAVEGIQAAPQPPSRKQMNSDGQHPPPPPMNRGGTGLVSIAPRQMPVTSPPFIPKRTLQFADHLIHLVGLLSLSAIFAGLTIGILALDSLTLEIIAESGPQPDCKYAQDILPLRRNGHQTLCTLILTNMLANVLIVQEMITLQSSYLAFSHPGRGLRELQMEIAENEDSQAITSFILSTLFILIFTEILPMSLCKSKHSLRIASLAVPLVHVAMVVTWPIAMPLGKFLDSFIPHDAGQIYDRNELKKLMMVHYESHSDKSGLVQTEIKLLLAAMEFHEKHVRDVMTPVEKVFFVYLEDKITADFLEKIWRSGRSRVPVATSDGRFCDVLLVRDLTRYSKGPFGIAVLGTPHTVKDILAIKSRNVPTVDENTPLPSMLMFFERVNTHMVIVHREVNANDNSSISAVSPVSGMPVKSYLTVPDSAPGSPTTQWQRNTFGEFPMAQSPTRITVGIITLEDVVEELIREEIYDEYDSENECFEEDAPIPNTRHSFQPASIENSHLFTLPFRIPRPPRKRPRVNFFSYYVHDDEDIELNDGQVWAAAYYLVDMCPLFASWKIGYVKYLLDEVGDVQLRPMQPLSQMPSEAATLSPERDSSENLTPTSSAASTESLSGGRRSSSRSRVLFHRRQSMSGNMPFRFPPESPSTFGKEATPSSAGTTSPGVKTKIGDERHKAFAESAASDEYVLYRKGEAAHDFTIVLSGSVDILVGNDGFVSQMRTFQFLGEEALLREIYVPEFTAVVRAPTRLYQIPKEKYEALASLATNNAKLPRSVSKSAFADAGTVRLLTGTVCSPTIPLIITGPADTDYSPATPETNLRADQRGSFYGTFAK